MVKPLTTSFIGLTLLGKDIVLQITVEYSSFNGFWAL
jgi:hypothetical protein